jgi:hypothetical protein
MVKDAFPLPSSPSTASAEVAELKHLIGKSYSKCHPFPPPRSHSVAQSFTMHASLLAIALSVAVHASPVAEADPAVTPVARANFVPIYRRQSPSR